jgi:hypothetical protein
VVEDVREARRVGAVGPRCPFEFDARIAQQPYVYQTKR